MQRERKGLLTVILFLKSRRPTQGHLFSSNWTLLIVSEVEGAFCFQLQGLQAHRVLTVCLPKPHPSLWFLKTSRYDLARMCFPKREVVSELGYLLDPSWARGLEVQVG